MANCPICSTTVHDQVELCPQCGFNLRLGPPAEQEPRPRKEARPPEPDPTPEEVETAEPVQPIGEPSPPVEERTILTRCEQCGESRVDAIFRCQQRPLGNCPYGEKPISNWDPKVGRVVIIVAVVLGLLIAFLIKALHEKEEELGLGAAFGK